MTSSHVAVALAWTLIHALWQTSVLALLYALWRYRTAASSARRYRVASSVLAVASAAVIATFAGLMAARVPAPTPVVDAPSGGSGAIFEQVEGTGADSVAAPVPRSQPRPPLRLEGVLTGLCWGWLAGSAAFAVRIGGGLWLAWRIRARAQTSTSDAVARAFARVAPHLPTRPVALLESDEIESPATLGLGRPAVLIPRTLAHEGSPDVLEPLLAHELAHVRSHDYAANLVQSAIDTLLFFCPGARWLSADVRRLREYRCDDAAVALMAGPDVYVRALAGIAESGRRFLPLPVPGAAGPRLVERAQRLLEGEAMNRLSPLRLLLVAGSVVTLVAAGTRVAPTSWAAAAEKAPAKAAAAPPSSSQPAAVDPSIARDLQTIPISGSTCADNCVVRIDEVRRGTDSLIDTVRLRNQSDQTITSVVLTGFFETNWDPKAGPVGPVRMRRSNDIPVQIAPGASADVRVRMWPVNDTVNPPLSFERSVQQFKEVWRNHSGPSAPMPPITSYVEVTGATRADGTQWGVTLPTEPWSPDADRLAPKDCVTPNGHKVKHGSGFPTLDDQGPPVQCLGGRWFQHGPATQAPGPNETGDATIPASAAPCPEGCPVRVESFRSTDDYLFETVTLRNVGPKAIRWVNLVTHFESNETRNRQVVTSEAIPVDLQPGATVDLRVGQAPMRRLGPKPTSDEERTRPEKIESYQFAPLQGNDQKGPIAWPAAFWRVAEFKQGAPKGSAHIGIFRAGMADGTTWGALQGSSVSPACETAVSNDPRGLCVCDGGKEGHGKLEATNGFASLLPGGRWLACQNGRWRPVNS
jgi:beta-lactamase regulating signal transducer with metallopeptidase domain